VSRPTTGPAGRAAEEVHHAALAHHSDGLLQVAGRATASMTTSAPRASSVSARTAATVSTPVLIRTTSVAPKVACRCDLVLALHHRDHAYAAQLGRVHKHQADRPRADDDHGVARARARRLQAEDDAASGSVSAAFCSGTFSGTCSVFFPRCAPESACTLS